MSDVERRQAQQRAFSVAACAAVAAIGGPLVAYRAEIRQTDEAYRTEAYILARSLSVQTRTAEAEAPRAGIQLASLNSSGLRARQPIELAAATDQRPGVTYLFDLNPAAMETLFSGRFKPQLLNQIGFMDLLAERPENEKSEFQCLAEAVYYEARSEDTRGQIAVAEVVMNRVADPNFPDTICGVVYQGHYRVTGCQFTFTCDGALRYKPRGLAWDRARAVAMHVRLGFAKPVTNNATHYHTDYVDPYWAPGLVETQRIGTHIFYRFPKSKREWMTARTALAAYEARRAEERLLQADAPLVEISATPDLAAPQAEESIAL